MNAVVNLKDFKMKKNATLYDRIGAPVRLDLVENQGDIILKRVMMNIGRYEDKKVLFQQWPNLDQASKKLCQLFSHHYPGKDGPLVEEVLKRAFNAYDSATEDGVPEVQRVATFLEALASAADDAQGIAAYVFDGDGNAIAWPHFSEPLGQWLRHVPGTELHFGRSPQPSREAIVGGRMTLCSKIMGFADIGKLLNHQFTVHPTRMALIR